MEEKCIKYLKNQIELLEVYIKCEEEFYKTTRSRELRNLIQQSIKQKNKELVIIQEILRMVKGE